LASASHQALAVALVALILSDSIKKTCLAPSLQALVVAFSCTYALSMDCSQGWREGTFQKVKQKAWLAPSSLT